MEMFLCYNDTNLHEFNNFPKLSSDIFQVLDDIYKDLLNQFDSSHDFEFIKMTQKKLWTSLSNFHFDLCYHEVLFRESKFIYTHLIMTLRMVFIEPKYR